VKVLTWNCNLQFSEKSQLIESFDADVLIIQECEKLPMDFLPGFQLFWVGRNENKGLAVLVRGKDAHNVNKSEDDFAYFLPIQTSFGLIVGVWSFNQRAKRFGSGVSGYIIDFLETYICEISTSSKVVIAGDFNNGPRWDIRRFHRNNFRLIQNELTNQGFKSSYHEALSENVGNETLGTHFHQRNPLKSHHIDYIFSKGYNIGAFEVGEFSNWRNSSDHVPLVAELN
jgi:exonuclease III